MRATFLFMLVLVASCTSTRPLTDPTFTQERLSEQLNVEDYIWITKKDGEGLNLVVDSIEATYFLGHNKRGGNLIIQYSLIEEIRIHQPDKRKTAVLAIVGGLFVILVSAFVISGGPVAL